MYTFLELNRHKLMTAFATSSLAILVPLCIFLIIGYYTGNFPELKLLLTILCSAGIGLPLFVIFFGYFPWVYKNYARRKVLSISPFNQIENIGFYRSLKYDKTKWHFTEEIKQGEINGFLLKFDISQEKNHIIEIEAPVEWQKIEKNKYKYLSEKYKQFNIEFRIGSLVKHYNTRKITVQSITELQKDLEQFTKILELDRFKSKREKDN